MYNTRLYLEHLITQNYMRRKRLKRKITRLHHVLYKTGITTKAGMLLLYTYKNERSSADSCVLQRVNSLAHFSILNLLNSRCRTRQTRNLEDGRRKTE